MAKTDHLMQPREYRRLNCDTLGHQISQIFIKSTRAHGMYKRELAKQNHAMILCSRALNRRDVKSAMTEFQQAATALEKMKVLDASIKKLYLMHKYAVEVYRDLPDQPDPDQMF